MTKRLISFYVALHLALAPVVSAFASTACHSLPSQDETSHCKHHHEAASLEHQNPVASEPHQNCHSEQDQDKTSKAKCSCHCAAPVAGLVNTLASCLAQSVSIAIVSPVKTQHSVTDTPLFKPPRA